MKWSPDQVTAVILIVGCLLLIVFKIDGEVKSILTIAAGWIFGGQYMARKRENGGK